ncbi:carbonic anhydrase [uncultured Phascolarctobacterium sp.]|jgi:carbonic anhydrase|uniref:beta-class carbonic anhydrase n=1 Tax=uncultured Phascolarctobacterium sp. TaxID=512296 RepID=UPI0015AC2BEA|nr:carbonic anhydrase [uncultured Phascolarctobacterium sp.]
MTTLLQEILAHNRTFLEKNAFPKEISKYPGKKFALLTCMDTRLAELINNALGIHRGDAKIIQNAGTSLIEDMGETVKSLLLTIYIFDIKEILIVGHYDCGVAQTSSAAILQKMHNRGIADQQIALIEDDFKAWLDTYTDPAQNVLAVVKKLRANPFIPGDISIHGLIIDPHSGKLDLLADGYKDTKG